MRNTFKFSTAIYLLLGIILPLWPITLPLFWFLAWRSYKGGHDPAPTLTDLQSAKMLLDQGAISQNEFEKIKRKAIR